MISIKVNLLPWRDELKVVREGLFKRMLVYAGLLGLLVAGGLSFVGKMILEDKNKRLVIIDQQLQAYQQAQTLLSERKAKKESLENQIKILKELGEQRNNVVHLMEVFATAVPEDSVVMTLGFTLNEIVFEALTKDQDVLVEHTRNITKQIGESPIPPSNDILLKNGKLVNYVVNVKPDLEFKLKESIKTKIEGAK